MRGGPKLRGTGSQEAQVTFPHITFPPNLASSDKTPDWSTIKDGVLTRNIEVSRLFLY